MAANGMGLGKGLGALIRETSSVRTGADVHTLPIKDIVPNPNQPRRKFAEKALEELAQSIKGQGLLQPILVRPLGEAQPGKYEIIAGERRWRASKLAGLVEVPVVVRSFTDQETLAAALIENLQREDLNPVEEALGIQTLKEEFSLSQEDLAARLGKSRSAIANSLRLLALPEQVRKDMMDGRLTAGHARALLSITSQRPQEYLRNLILEENLSVREAEGYASTWKDTGEFHPIAPGLPPDTAPVKPLPAAERDEDADLEHTAPSAENVPARITEEPLNALSPEAETLPRRSRPQSAVLVDIQQRIGNALSVPVRVTGKESKGKISIAYNSKEELETLLQRLQGTEQASGETSAAGFAPTPLATEQPQETQTTAQAVHDEDEAAFL